MGLHGRWMNIDRPIHSITHCGGQTEERTDRITITLRALWSLAAVR